MAWAVPAAVTTSTTIATSWGTQVRDNFTALDTMLAPASQAWTAFTISSVTQSGAVTFTTDRAFYRRVGRIITGHAVITLTGAGTTSNVVTVGVSGLPAAKDANSVYGIGVFSYNEVGTSNYVGSVRGNAASITSFAGDIIGFSPAFAAASGDIISIQFTYESAS
jgi:hypothetical protein